MQLQFFTNKFTHMLLVLHMFRLLEMHFHREMNRRIVAVER